MSERMGMVDAIAVKLEESKAWPMFVKPGSARELVAFVLREMREPPPEMLEAVTPCPEHLIRERNDPDYERQMRAATIADQMTFRSQWQEAIDAALGGKG